MNLNRRLEGRNHDKTSFMAKSILMKLVCSNSFQFKAETMKLKKFIKKKGAGRYLADIKISIS